MIRTIRFVAILGVVALGLSPFVAGTPEYTEREKKECTYCHTAKGRPELNDAGKYYKDHDHSLAGYKEPKKP